MVRSFRLLVVVVAFVTAFAVLPLASAGDVFASGPALAQAEERGVGNGPPSGDDDDDPIDVRDPQAPSPGYGG